MESTQMSNLNLLAEVAQEEFTSNLDLLCYVALQLENASPMKPRLPPKKRKYHLIEDQPATIDQPIDLSFQSTESSPRKLFTELQNFNSSGNTSNANKKNNRAKQVQRATRSATKPEKKSEAKPICKPAAKSETKLITKRDYLSSIKIIAKPCKIKTENGEEDSKIQIKTPNATATFSQIRKRKPAAKVPNELKDAAYWINRAKNNAAAKKSRENKSIGLHLAKKKATELEEKNENLGEQIDEQLKPLLAYRILADQNPLFKMVLENAVANRPELETMKKLMTMPSPL